MGGEDSYLLEALRDAIAALGGIRSDSVPESCRVAIARATQPEALD